MPFCSHCGKEVSEDATFCPKCGQRLMGFTPEERQKYIEELKASTKEQEWLGKQRETEKPKGEVKKQEKVIEGKLPRGNRMTSLSKLPQVSDSFLNHIEGHLLKKNEWMPCPRCGQSAVEPPNGALAGILAGFSTIGCLILILAIVGIILGIIFWPLAVIFVVVGLIMIPFLPIIGAGLGLNYSCKSCGYNWTFRDVENYKKSID